MTPQRYGRRVDGESSKRSLHNEEMEWNCLHDRKTGGRRGRQVSRVDMTILIPMQGYERLGVTQSSHEKDKARVHN